MQSPTAVPVVVGALFSICFEKDNQMHWLEKKYMSGKGSGVDNTCGVLAGSKRKPAQQRK
jgi:hypothetical protein